MTDKLITEGRQYLDLKARKDELEEELKEVKANLEALSRQMVEEMDSIELDKFSAFGSTFSVRRTLAANVKAEDKEALFWVLRNEGHGHLIKEDVNARTLAAFVKEQMGEDGTIPEWIAGLVDVYYRNDISARKAGKA